MTRPSRFEALLVHRDHPEIYGVAGNAEPDAGDKQGPHMQRGCPAGAVCIFPSAGWNSDQASEAIWTYGAHNLSNQTGRKRIYPRSLAATIEMP